MKQKFYPLWITFICIVLFIIQKVIPNFTDLFILNQEKPIEIWRFLSSIFLHGNSSHLILNLFALLLFGLILEKLIGSKKFLLVYLSTGIIANIIAINFYPLSLGASGAIYGIIGCLTILRPKMGVFIYNVPMPMFIASIIWILIGIFGLFIPSNTGHIAHLSGIFFGFLFGFYFMRRYGEQKKPKLSIKIPAEHMEKWEDVYMR